MQELRIGVAGLGRGFSLMLPTFQNDPRVRLVAAADPRPEARGRFADEFSAKTYENVEDLCADGNVDVVYVATPHQLHAPHANLAARAGKHLLVEKPMALSLAECGSMIEAARQAGIQLIVGHSHSFNAPIARARALIESGAFGGVRMIAALNYTDFVYRPRRPEELDTTQGGGVLFSQGAHQVDSVRLLAGSPVVTVRAFTGVWDRERAMDGAYAALLGFANGAAASLTYSGYGRFSTDTFQDGIGELGYRRQPANPPAFGNAAEESAFKQSRNYGGTNFAPPPAPDAHQSFGTLIVSCEAADIRPMPDRVIVCRNGREETHPIPAPAIPRVEVIDELYAAVAGGVPPKHSGEWAMDTLEVCLAILRSSREGQEVALAGADKK